MCAHTYFLLFSVSLSLFVGVFFFNSTTIGFSNGEMSERESERESDRKVRPNICKRALLESPTHLESRESPTHNRPQ